MRKLCTGEIGGVKMEKKKKTFCNSKVEFIAIFWMLIWLYISKMICKA